MSGNVIEILVKAIDQASSPIREVTESLGALKSAAVGFLGGEAVLRTADTFIENTKDAEAAVVKLTRALDNSVESASASSRELLEWSSQISKSSTFSSDSLNLAQAALVRYDRVSSDVFPRARKAALDLAAGYGTDVVSAANAVGRALEAPAMGMRLLSAEGVVFTTQQREVITQLDKTGQAAKAGDIILNQIERTYHDAADTATNTLGGALTKLKNQFSDLFKSDDASILTKALNSIADAIGNINAATEKNKSASVNLRTQIAVQGLNGGVLALGAGTDDEMIAELGERTPPDFVARGGRNRGSSPGGDFVPQEVLDQRRADARAAALQALQPYALSSKGLLPGVQEGQVSNKIRDTNQTIADLILGDAGKLQDRYNNLLNAVVAPGVYNVTQSQAQKALYDFLDKQLPEFETPNQQDYQNQRVAQGLSRVSTTKLSGEKLASKKNLTIISDAERDADKVINELDSKLVALAEQGQLTGRSLVRSLVESLRDTTIKGAIDDLATYLEKSLHAALAASSASGGGGFLAGLAGFVGGLFGGKSSSTSGVSAGMSVDEYLASTGGSHAGGGDWSGITEVGENGPEWIAGRGTVFNSQQLRSIVGGGSGSVYAPQTTINVGKGGDSDSVSQRKLAALLDYKLAQNNQAVMNQFSTVMRNNGFGRLRT